MRLVLTAAPGEIEKRAGVAVAALADAIAPYDGALAERVRAAIAPPPLQRSLRRTRLGGLWITIENEVGSLRHWRDPATGERGTTEMRVPYGYLHAVDGADGDKLDCYLGPDAKSENVWVVHQLDARTRQYDEDKVMLGFSSAHAALECFRTHRNDFERTFGGITHMTFDELRARLRAIVAGEPHDGMIKAGPIVVARDNVASEDEEEEVEIKPPKLPTIPALIMEKATPGFVMENRGTAEHRSPSLSGADGMNLVMLSPIAHRQENQFPPPSMELFDLPPSSAPPPSIVEAARTAWQTFVQAPPRPRPVQLPALSAERDLADEARLRETARARVEERAAVNALPASTSEPVRGRPPAASARPGQTWTTKKRGVGECTLIALGGTRFAVQIGRKTTDHGSLSEACDHVWALAKGYASADAARAALGVAKLPSGAGWRFWGQTNRVRGAA